ncbi:MAG: glycosyltransferase [Candidatus Abyssobacteria bacterium SURF_5]|uniref:Glycosyltransferase n=1 Tax=Abyssobacteria bacterium (strain SURF_5) TaxID=2093360 RepID=A0A3A4NPU0_ABYX5|nr:MAG: glycosyltransferase [Candidatus Abyssubacteria bacterium SURF_5]
MPKNKKKGRRIGFISTRFAGTDGVSLETAKWAQVLEELGHSCFYFAGELDRPPEISMLVKEAHFMHPEIRDVYTSCFETSRRRPEVTRKIYALKEQLKETIYEFIREFEIDLLIPENAVTIPLNIPLGLALTEVTVETRIPTIAHHHDFFWERKHFLVNSASDYLTMAFPPNSPGIQHVVINSTAANLLAHRRGISSTFIPNVMDFDNPPPPLDEYARDVRQVFGLQDDELFILQPTRVVKRKGIETSIELVRRLDRKAKLIISHASGDEGHGYEQRLREYSKMLNVDTLFVSGTISDKRAVTLDGRKIYTIEDVYPHADFITYPSTFEGFGNAFLEAIYFRKPIAVNLYSVYSVDIKPRGFKVVELEDYVTDSAIRLMTQLLDNPKLTQELVEHNYNLGKRYYSYRLLKKKLGTLLSESFGY